MSNETCTFEAKLSELPKILAWVRTQLEPTLLSLSEKKRVETALEEAVVNIINHAISENLLELTLTCRCEKNRQIEFDVCDFGPPFNPLTHPEPSIELSLDEREIGGLGLSIMRKCMDALFYRREDDQNILTLIKNIDHSKLSDFRG